jgi:FkbM family methyltransferase
LKPWFAYRPGQFLRRIGRAAFPPREPIQVVRLPWGCPLEIDIRETIGRAVWNCGVYDLAVVEVLTRLADPELLAIDAGANIGAMTGALAARAAEVWAFEPHPEVFLRLKANIARFAGRPGFSPTTVFEIALSAAEGEAHLENPDLLGTNHGLARITTADTGLVVKTTRLDSLLGDRAVGVLKLDVEGHELSVLHGTETALNSRRVRHIVFENHGGAGSPVCAYLMSLGYHLFEIGWRLTGPNISRPGAGGAKRYEAPSYLATREPDSALARCGPRGWECLRSPRRRGNGA